MISNSILSSSSSSNCIRYILQHHMREREREREREGSLACDSCIDYSISSPRAVVCKHPPVGLKDDVPLVILQVGTIGAMLDQHLRLLCQELIFPEVLRE